MVQGNRFEKTLPKKTMFVFEDPKDEGEFYAYINTKFALNDYRVDVDVPVQIDGMECYFAYYEVEIPTKTLNLIPLFIDGLLAVTEDAEPLLSDVYESRRGHWYIAIEVYDNEENDCIAETSKLRKPLINYLSKLRNEYVNTHNYNEVVFKD